MVRLEKITIQGFKSFKRNASFPFPTNFSVITGPNGSGKSNLNDAVHFVLGKSSSKTIRAKKAQDLVFHGSKKKTGSDHAKVTLHFSNSEKKIPIEEDKVIVSRRLNKEGVSSYRLNGKVNTRQQILDIFMQGRMNPGGHNIIKQGDVTKVIEMNPIERRKIIDEISGILEYDEKKLQALKELEKVEEKVKEAEIIIETKEEIITKLQDDRDSAIKYQQMQNELEMVKSVILFKEYSSAEKGMANADTNIDDMESEIDNLGKKVDQIDIKMDAKEKELENMLKDVFNMSGQVELSKKVHRMETSIESKENQIDANERELGRIQKTIESLSMISKRVNPNIKEVMEFDGVKGILSDLIMIPDQYRVAADVAGGSHMNDIVVKDTNVAVRCVKHLKENKLGRARFLPMDKINSPPKGNLPDGTFGWMSELIQHDPEYIGIIDFVFGRTAAVNDIDKAKDIGKRNRIRMVTLDGDLVESSGAITGGYFVRSNKSPETKNYMSQKKSIEEEISILNLEIEDLREQLQKNKKGIKTIEGPELEKKRQDLKNELDELRDERKELYENRMNLQTELNKIKISKAKYEANYDNIKVEWEMKKKSWEKLEGRDDYEKKGLQILKDSERDLMESMNLMGAVNMKAIDEFEILKDEFDEFRERVDKIVEEKESILSSIEDIEDKKRATFSATLEEMSKLFKDMYREITDGEAYLELEEPNDLSSGLHISASPPGKKLLYIDSMSGGEKVLTALTFLFTIQRYKPAPFYLLDEVDAALDKINTRKVADLIRKQSNDIQFIVISHNNEMIRAADSVYGVSMEEGESKVIGVKLPETS